MKDKVAADCRFFSGESPCVFHKEYGVKCGDCRYYNPVKERILIIKMGAKGDVLRTTCILTGLKEKYPDSHITWVVERGSQKLLQNVKIPHRVFSPSCPDADLSPEGDRDSTSKGRIKERGKENSDTMSLIDRVLEFSLETFVILQAEKFDLVLSLDSSVVSAGLAEKINADEKKGFGLNREGKIYPFNPEAEEWFRMGIFDDLKRNNKKTYQEIILEIAGISTKNYEIIVNLTDEEKEFARDFSKERGIDGSSPIIGLNTGAGGRWQLKKWTLDGYLELIKRLHEELSARVLLFGAGEEKERNQWLKENSPYPVIDTGSGNTLREFFALLNLCDIIAAGDTLAVHAAVGLRKKVVVLFGPTSPSEIELYGRGEKIIAPVDCIGCYRQSCDREPSCMELITVKAVFDAILRLLRR